MHERGGRATHEHKAMSDFNEQLKKKSDAIKLRVTERRELRERIVAYMEYHPLPENLKTSATKRAAGSVQSAVVSEPFFTYRFGGRYLKSAAVLGMLLFVVGVPTLAERSLPGDVLYPMKVLVNEEVRSSLAFSPYAKVEWEATRLERRLSEARLLAQEGKLTEDVEREVAEAVKQHSDSAQETILALRETDSDGAALAEIAFASVLEAQADIMTLGEEQAKLADASSEVVSSTVLASAVREAHADALSAQRERPATPERLFALIERDTTYAQELLDAIEDGATEREAQNIARRLADISRKVSRAQELQSSLASLEEGIVEPAPVNAEATSSTEADALTATLAVEAAPSRDSVSAEVISILRVALTDTRKLISFMTDIEVRHTVDVEQLIPITLTDEERVAEVNSALERARGLRGEVEARVVPDEVATKVEFGLGELELAIARSTAALDANALTDAESAAAEAEALALDVRALVGESPLESVSETSTTTPATSTPTTTEPNSGVEGDATTTTNTTTTPVM